MPILKPMKTKVAINFFKNQQGLADALGITQPSVAGWGDTVPPLRQLQLERITKGALKAEKRLKPRPLQRQSA